MEYQKGIKLLQLDFLVTRQFLEILLRNYYVNIITQGDESVNRSRASHLRYIWIYEK